MNVDFVASSQHVDGLRRNALRGATLGMRVLRHPTWALAHIQNLLDRRLDRRYGRLPAPRGGYSLSEALGIISGADARTIDAILTDVPQPALQGNSVLYGDPNASGELVALTYACCRLWKPDTVLETGVANGFTTAAILRALAENEQGTLSSIDLPHLHPKALESIGAAVDPALRGRWRLHLGPAARLIPVVVGSGGIDIFVQDAAHTFRGQRAEYRAGWSLLKEDGVLISDDIGPGFARFAQEVGHRPIYISQEPKRAPIGVLIKSSAWRVS